MAAGALLESSTLTLVQEWATRGWLPHHVPNYAHGDPADGFYEVPLSHPDATGPALAGLHRQFAVPTPSIHHDSALVQSSSHGTVGNHTSIFGDS